MDPTKRKSPPETGGNRGQRLIEISFIFIRIASAIWAGFALGMLLEEVIR